MAAKLFSSVWKWIIARKEPPKPGLIGFPRIAADLLFLHEQIEKNRVEIRDQEEKIRIEKEKNSAMHRSLAELAFELKKDPVFKLIEELAREVESSPVIEPKLKKDDIMFR